MTSPQSRRRTEPYDAADANDVTIGTASEISL
jgi:hypothetical protein